MRFLQIVVAYLEYLNSGFSGLPTALRLLQRKASLTQCNCSSRVFVSSFQKGVLFLQKFVKEAPIINWTRLKNGQVCTKIFSTESRDQFVKPFFWEKKVNLISDAEYAIVSKLAIPRDSKLRLITRFSIPNCMFIIDFFS